MEQEKTVEITPKQRSRYSKNSKHIKTVVEENGVSKFFVTQDEYNKFIKPFAVLE